MSIKKILLATRPLTPPWDEASKNFAYFLAKSIKDPELQMNILTTPTTLDGLGDNVIAHPIFPLYDATRAGHSFSQKAILSSYLFTKSCKYDIVHYLFTPTVFNSRLIRFGNRLQGVISAKAGIQESTTSGNIPTKTFEMLDSRLRGNDIQKSSTQKESVRFKTIQTIATLREDLYGIDDWKKMFFADKLVVYSDYSKYKLEAAGFENVTRIYPGIDLNLYSPQPKDAETMKHFNITPEDFVIAYFGEYARLGATDMLVEMLINHLKPNSQNCHPELACLPDRQVSGSPFVQNYSESNGMLKQVQHDSAHKNIKFIFACRVKNDADQKKKDEVMAKLTQAGIIDSVRFSDTFKDMPKLYNLTDIVLFPVENMRGKFDIPLVIIEGYACGKPVIVSDLPIFKEFTNESISTIIPREDNGILWTKIIELKNDEVKRKALSVNARAFVEQHFDLQNTAREYKKIYQSL
jgi:glycosyltransferase involved in cell wall biosynthesis